MTLEKSLGYARNYMKISMDKVKLYERDVVTQSKSLSDIESQIIIKKYNHAQMINKLEDKLLEKSDIEILKVVVKHEKS